MQECSDEDSDGGDGGGGGKSSGRVNGNHVVHQTFQEQPIQKHPIQNSFV